jgi:hypothetical protein
VVERVSERSGEQTAKPPTRLSKYLFGYKAWC